MSFIFFKKKTIKCYLAISSSLNNYDNIALIAKIKASILSISYYNELKYLSKDVKEKAYFSYINITYA